VDFVAHDIVSERRNTAEDNGPLRLINPDLAPVCD
jgi:hypothetical protein